MSRIFWYASISLVGSLSAPPCADAQQPRSKAQKVPDSLVDFGEFGENLYDFAKAGEWPKAAEKFKALEGAAKQLPGDLKETKADKAKREEAVAALGKAVAAKDKTAAMQAANRLTLIAADLTEPFNPPVPAAVTRLDAFGRELEMAAEAKAKDRLKAATEGLRKNWDKVRSAVKAKGGDAEAKRFEELVGKAEAAKAADDFGKLAKPILDEVDNLEKVFKK